MTKFINVADSKSINDVLVHVDHIISLEVTYNHGKKALRVDLSNSRSRYIYDQKVIDHVYTQVYNCETSTPLPGKFERDMSKLMR